MILELVSNRKMRFQTIDYPVKFVEIKTCGQFYEQRKKQKKLYRKADPSGITTVVEYADTKSNLSQEELETAPVVLCLHGAPGSHKDYMHLIHYLSLKRVRVVAPNFPNYYLTETTKVFRHSAEEKAEYIKDFLRAINLTKIDVLVSHSSAIYPSAILWKNQDNLGLQIKSIAMINPSGHRRIRAMRPKIVTSPAVRIYQNKYGRLLFRKFGTTVLSITGCAVKPNNMDNVLLSATTMVYSGFKRLSKYLEEMREANLPILFIFSENDRLVEKEIFEEMRDILGIAEDKTDIFDQDESPVKLSTTDSNYNRFDETYSRALCFTSGGHYTHLKHPSAVNESIQDLLSFVQSKETSWY